ncbi:MAG: MBL fold metallo-hydrolase, partial [Actinomycetota bacterium]|nr:MBL fold metallo-hydrolase [Actinomycetota bacterium]
MKIEIVDLDFMNTGQVIASFPLLGEDGTSAALVETGPTNCPDRLTASLKDRGVSYGDERQVYLTHIHLDHSGASGHLSWGAAQRDFLRARDQLPAPCPLLQ